MWRNCRKPLSVIDFQRFSNLCLRINLRFHNFIAQFYNLCLILVFARIEYAFVYRVIDRRDNYTYSAYDNPGNISIGQSEIIADVGHNQAHAGAQNNCAHASEYIREYRRGSFDFPVKFFKLVN